MMSTESRFGRTPADLAAELLKPRLFVPVLLFVLITVMTGIHLVAEPGSEISFLWGLVKYQKSKGPISSNSFMARSIAAYYLPKKVYIHSQDTIPILDKTLNLSVNGEEGLILGGTNIEIIRIGARTPSGEPMEPKKRPDGSVRFGDFYYAVYIEIEYKESFFSIEFGPPYQGSPIVELNPIASASLQLTEYSRLFQL